MDTENKKRQNSNPAKKSISWKKIAGVITGGIVSFVVFYAIGSWIVNHYYKQPNIDSQLVKIASDMNRLCPMTIDEFTRLDKGVALPDNVFQYNYTLTEEFDRLNITDLDGVFKFIREASINNLKTAPDSKYFRDHKTTLIFYYRNAKGKFVYKFTVTPDMYT